MLAPSDMEEGSLVWLAKVGGQLYGNALHLNPLIPEAWTNSSAKQIGRSIGNDIEYVLQKTIRPALFGGTEEGT